MLIFVAASKYMGLTPNQCLGRTTEALLSFLQGCCLEDMWIDLSREWPIRLMPVGGGFLADLEDPNKNLLQGVPQSKFTAIRNGAWDALHQSPDQFWSDQKSRWVQRGFPKPRNTYGLNNPMDG